MAKHKCFISYHKDDAAEVEQFIETFDQERKIFISRAVGLGDEDDLIDSEDREYVMRCLREQYLTDSTVTIVMVGQCTWARKYVDWEIGTTLRNDAQNKRSGLMAILLPSRGTSGRLPDRFKDNYAGENGDEGYARFYAYPKRADTLERWIEDAFQARDSRAHLVNNTRELFKNNRKCP